MKRSLLTMILACSCIWGMAQQKENRDANGNILRGPYETNSFWSNWYISAGGGINMYEGEAAHHISPALDISVGKWMTPSYGIRLQYAGLKAKGYQEFNVSNIHVDFMWNWVNGIFGFNEKRIWNFIPYAGFGLAHSWMNSTRNNEIAATFGILNTFRISKRLDLTLEGRQMLMKGTLDGIVGGSKVDGMTSVTLGLNVKLGKTRFNRVKEIMPVDFSEYNQRINALRAENNALDAKSQRLATELDAMKNRQPEVIDSSKVTASPVALFFEIGKATLDTKELANLEFYVNNAIKADKNKTFTLIGSADNATGSKIRNQQLSEQRMEYVYGLLTNKYGIPSERLVKKAEGDTKNHFSEPELNRVVIVK